MRGEGNGAGPEREGWRTGVCDDEWDANGGGAR